MVATGAQRRLAGRIYRKIKRTAKRAPSFVQNGAKRLVPRQAQSYTFSVRADTVPEALLIEIPQAASKSFVLLPGEPASGYGSVAKPMAFSKELGGKYLYINEPHTEVELARPAIRPEGDTIDFTVTLVRWRRDPRLKFPRTIVCRSSAVGQSGIRVAGELTLAVGKPVRKQ